MIIFLSIILTIFISANIISIFYCVGEEDMRNGFGMFLTVELILIGILLIWGLSFAISKGIVCNATNNDHKGCKVEIKTEESEQYKD